MGTRIGEHFEKLDDPRKRRGRRHLLAEMMVIALCAVICAADNWKAVSAFGRAKRKWFRTFLRLPHGIPSHYTFDRVFAALHPAALERCFSDWITALSHQKERLVAIDGKTLRHSFDRADGKAAIHMISAWAAANELVFGQVACEAKSNEITAIPKLLELLDLKAATVTIDAEGCQKAIAGQITEQGGDYVLALKANHPTLHNEVKLFLDTAIGANFRDIPHDSHHSVDGGHGRVETRRVWVTSDVDWFADRAQWPGLRSFAAVERERQTDKGTTIERHYFISSLPGTDAAEIGKAIRGHWGIENKLHWVLDVCFQEDASRVRKGHGAQNFSRLRRMALNLLRREKTEKLGIANKRLLAGWDHDYLLRLLAG